MEWHVVPNYQDAEEGDSEWTLKGRDEEGLEKAKEVINEALEHAKASTHVGPPSRSHEATGPLLRIVQGFAHSSMESFSKPLCVLPQSCPLDASAHMSPSRRVQVYLRDLMFMQPGPDMSVSSTGSFIRRSFLPHSPSSHRGLREANGY